MGIRGCSIGQCAKQSWSGQFLNNALRAAWLTIPPQIGVWSSAVHDATDPAG